MSDIVELLRAEPHSVPSGLALEAAAEIEHLRDENARLRGVEQDAVEWVEERTKRLRADNERLRAALQPFAIASDGYDDEPPARVIASRRGSILSVYDLRAAKAALE